MNYRETQRLEEFYLQQAKAADPELAASLPKKSDAVLQQLVNEREETDVFRQAALKMLDNRKIMKFTALQLLEDRKKMYL